MVASIDHRDGHFVFMFTFPMGARENIYVPEKEVKMTLQAFHRIVKLREETGDLFESEAWEQARGLEQMMKLGSKIA